MGSSGDAFVPASHRPFPTIFHGSGPVLSPVTVVTITAANETLTAELDAFSDALVASSWWTNVTAPYGLEAPASSLHLDGPAITTSPTQAEMVAYIQGVLAAGGPQPNGKTCYVLYLPAAVSGANSGIPASAFHAPFPSLGASIGDGYAMVSRQSPYVGGETQLEELTRVASHEIVECATDPTWSTYTFGAPSTPAYEGSVWSVYEVPGPVECGDLCEGTRILETSGDASFEYQRIFGGDAGANGDPCRPQRAETYFNVSTPKDWYSTADGPIPLTGWSSAATGDWYVLASPVYATTGFQPDLGAVFEATSPLGADQDGGQCYGVGMNNGVTATLDVTVPPGAQSGDYVVLAVESYRLDVGQCSPPLGDDQFHLWVVGLYVP